MGRGVLNKSEGRVTISKFNFRKRRGCSEQVRSQIQFNFRKRWGEAVILNKLEGRVTIPKFNFNFRKRWGGASSDTEYLGVLKKMSEDLPPPSLGRHNDITPVCSEDFEHFPPPPHPPSEHTTQSPFMRPFAS